MHEFGTLYDHASISSKLLVLKWLFRKSLPVHQSMHGQQSVPERWQLLSPVQLVNVLLLVHARLHGQELQR